MNNPVISRRKPSYPSNSTSGAGIVNKLFLLLVLIITIVLTLFQFVPPAVVSAKAPPTIFSAERAMQHLGTGFSQPHPMGSKEHAALEKYLIDQLTQMGLNPQVQATTSINAFAPDSSNIVIAGNVRNIVARIPGTANTKAILLLAHYDSMPTTPATNDGGTGTATLLETARAILAGKPLKNDVILYFGDADVNGLIGSGAFAKEHPWRNDFALAMGFEGIGTRGPSFLTYTSEGNGWFLPQVIKAAPHPVTLLAFNSPGFSPDLWNVLHKGASALGFGYFFDLQAYHSWLDNPQRTDLRSVQHHGSYALSLTRHFGNLPLDNDIRAPDVLAFNLWRGRVIYYPVRWTKPLAIIGATLFISVVIIGLRRRQLSLGGLLFGALAFLVSTIATVTLTTLIWWAIKQLNPNYHVFMHGTYNASFHLWGSLALTLALMVIFYSQVWTRRLNFRTFDLTLGAWSWWLLLSLLTGFNQPFMSYLFTLPLIVSLLVLNWMLLTPQSTTRPWLYTAGLTVSAVPTLLLITPIIYLVFLFSQRYEKLIAAPSDLPLLGIPVFIFTLMLGIMLPHLLFLVSPHQWRMPVSLATLFGIIFIALGLVTSGFSASQPRPNYIAYVLNADTGKATWVSATEQLDQWTKQFFPKGATPTRFLASPGYFPESLFPALEASAPTLTLPAPNIQVLNDTVINNTRTVRLQVTSPRQAPYIRLQVDTKGIVTAMSINGKVIDYERIPKNITQVPLMFFAVPANGFELTMSVQSPAPIQIIATDYSNGLPNIPGILPRSGVAERATTMPALYDFADPTIVNKSFQLVRDTF